jgi:hypothetical protein
MKKTSAIVAIVLLSLGASAHAQQSCEPSGGLNFICGLTNAEDLVAVPGTPWIIASGMAEGASISLIDSRNKTWSKLYPGDKPRAALDSTAFEHCRAAPTNLITHGLNLRPGEGGHHTLYAVGHGGREAIEVFDVDATGTKPTLTWIGCVPMPDGLAANSVASFEDGSILATVLILPGKTFQDSVLGKPTGAVYEWSPGSDGFELVKGSELPSNNGIEVSDDGSEFFVVSSGLHTIVAFSHTNPARQLRTTAHLPFTPDNVHMGSDGRLLTAGMKDDEPACGGAPGPQHTLEQLGACPRGFIAEAIDPRTMQHAVVAQGPANPAFSNATMILVSGRQFYVGTFRGDRIGYGVLQ